MAMDIPNAVANLKGLADTGLVAAGVVIFAVAAVLALREFMLRQFCDGSR